MPRGRSPPIRLRDHYTQHRLRSIALLLQFLSQLSEKLLHAVRGGVLEPDSVHAGSAAVGSDHRIGVRQDVRPAHLVVQRIENGSSALAWPCSIASVAAPGSSGALLDASSIAAFPCCFVRILEPGPLPSTGVTRLHRYYEPLRHPPVARRPRRLVAEPNSGHRRRASRVARCSLLTCRHPPPRRSGSNPSSSSFDPCQPSPSPGRVGLRIVYFGAVSVFTHVTACQLADGLTPPCVSQASTTSLPPWPLG